MTDTVDSAYDSPIIKKHSRSLGHVPIIDMNPRGNKERGDSVFHASKFPDTQNIMSFDSVSILNIRNWVTSGTGLDVDGASKYSEHYYNPRTKKGAGKNKFENNIYTHVGAKTVLELF